MALRQQYLALSLVSAERQTDEGHKPQDTQSQQAPLSPGLGGARPPDIMTLLPHGPEDCQHLREEGTGIFATLYKSLLQDSVSSSVNCGNNSSLQGAVELLVHMLWRP